MAIDMTVNMLKLVFGYYRIKNCITSSLLTNQYELDYKGKKVTVFHPGVGAALSSRNGMHEEK